MLQKLRKLTDNILNERPDTDLRFWRSAYLDIKQDSQDSLSLAYQALLELLLGIDSKDFEAPVTPAGAPLVGAEKGYCHYKTGLELAHLWQWIGHLKKDPKLQIKGKRAETFLLGLCDLWKKPFKGLWSDKTATPFLCPKHYPSIDLPLEMLPNAEDRALGLSTHHTKELSSVFTVTGKNTGLGAILKSDTGIVAFGPSLWPNEAFGCDFASLNVDEKLPGLHVKRHGPLYHFAGWTRIVADKQDLWCELSATIGMHAQLKLQFLDTKSYQISILMAVKAKSLRIGDQLELLQASLKKYTGDAKTIALEGDDSQMVLIPNEQGKMEIIPLAGDDAYWGADFLLIYPLDAHSPHKGWEIY